MAPPTPKSILKKTNYTPPSLPPDTVSLSPPPSTGSKPSPEEARAIALSHAHALQIRKVLELSILTSLEELVDYPLTRTSTTSTHPDGPTLKRHLRFFQPSDYDSLIEERNILDHCGYPLCPLPKKTLKTPSTYTLIDKGRSSMRFVERVKLERFCSDTCARRGLWLRVQLSDEPSWLRGDVLEGVEVGEKGEVYGLDLEGVRWTGEMTLLEEVEVKIGVEARVKEVDLKRLVEELQGLGIDSKGLLGKAGSKGEKVDVKVEEKVPSKEAAVPPSLDGAAVAALAVEGYNPRRGPDDYLPKKPQVTKQG